MLPAAAAVFYTETWDSGLSGWEARIPGDMTVSHAPGSGNLGGALLGSFGAQGVPAFQSGAFRATASASSASFTGDYWTDVEGWTGWRFDFLADSLLPSDVQLRLNGNAWTAWFNVTAQITQVGVWQSVFVPATYPGWLPPGNEINWSNALSNVQWLEVQVARNGSIAAQSYYMDNFEITMDTIAIIPEPQYAGLVLLFLGGFLRYRHTVYRRYRAMVEARELTARGRAPFRPIFDSDIYVCEHLPFKE